MEDCIFCKIVAGEIPNHTVVEDEHGLAFLDIFPLAKGHTVVIPKVHGETILDFEGDILQHLLPLVKKATQRIQEVLSPDGFNIGLNHGEVAGQSVPHLHIHIIPRYEGDGGKSLHGIIQNPGDMSVEEIARKFA